jgi:hypothetical protein
MSFAVLPNLSSVCSLPLVSAPAGDTGSLTLEPFVPTADQVQAEIAAAFSQDLSTELSQWVDRYATVGRRNPYLWKWCRQAVGLTTLPCVEPKLRENLCDTKTLGVVLDVLFDDIADQSGDSTLLEELLSLFEGGQPDLSKCDPSERAYAQFTVDVWEEIVRRAEQLPRYAEFQDILRFDYLQLGNVMRYSHLLNSHLDLLNLAEHDLYTPANMHIMICSTFDVMGSPDFDRRDLGRLREAVWNAQWMGRIGNLSTTWQRELGEADFTSGVYARAVAHGDLTVEQLLEGDRGVIEQAIIGNGHEDYYWHRWQEHRATMLSPRCHIRSFDIGKLVAGLERLVCLHLGSRGRK